MDAHPTGGVVKGLFLYLWTLRHPQGPLRFSLIFFFETNTAERMPVKTFAIYETTDGAGPPPAPHGQMAPGHQHLGDPLTPTNELAKPLGAEHVRKQLQRLYRAARALPGAAFAEAKHHRKFLVSSDQRPPTSQAMTTSWPCHCHCTALDMFSCLSWAHPELCRATRPPGMCHGRRGLTMSLVRR